MFRKGRRWNGRYLEVLARPASQRYPRLGLVVAKHGRKIVERNRLRRWLRELGRREVLPRLRTERAGLDVLIRARRNAYEASFAELGEELTQATEHLCSRRSPSR